jgi:hypothetical protein
MWLFRYTDNWMYKSLFLKLASVSVGVGVGYIGQGATSPRARGAMKVLGGGIEISLGAIGGTATSWAGIGGVVRGIAVVHGADVAYLGWNQLWAGKEYKSYTQKSISSGLQAAGVSQGRSEIIADFADAGISIFVSRGASYTGPRIASVEAAAKGVD